MNIKICADILYSITHFFLNDKRIQLECSKINILFLVKYYTYIYISWYVYYEDELIKFTKKCLVQFFSIETCLLVWFIFTTEKITNINTKFDNN